MLSGAPFKQDDGDVRPRHPPPQEGFDEILCHHRQPFVTYKDTLLLYWFIYFYFTFICFIGLFVKSSGFSTENEQLFLINYYLYRLIYLSLYICMSIKLMVLQMVTTCALATLLCLNNPVVDPKFGDTILNLMLGLYNVWNPGWIHSYLSVFSNIWILIWGMVAVKLMWDIFIVQVGQSSNNRVVVVARHDLSVCFILAKKKFLF
jgi:hypothetical protein